jgi:hypothetical protein
LDPLLAALHNQVVFSLVDAKAIGVIGSWRKEWKEVNEMNLWNALVDEWNQYIIRLKQNYLKLSNKEDDLKISKKQRYKN